MDHLLCLLIHGIVILSNLPRPLSRLGIGNYDEWNAGKTFRILLAGYNGARNTGSDVRVAAIARQFNELYGREHVQISVLTLDTDTLEGYFDSNVTLLPFSSLFPFDVFRACCSHHAAVLCEGSTLKSTFANALTLFLCETAGILSAQGKPCIAYGSEVGEMEPFLERTAARLCRNTYFITRTEESFDRLKKLGLRGHTGTDAAWLYDGAIPPDQADRLLRAQGWDGKKPLLGIAVINPFCWPVRLSLWKWLKGSVTGRLSGQYDKWYFFSNSPARRGAFHRYIAEIAAGVNSFMESRDSFPVLIGMERLDALAVSALAHRLDRPCAVFLSGEYFAGIITGVLRRLSALVTSRYHAAVLSMGTGCPIVAVSMDERLDGIMREVSLDGEYLFHVTDRNLGAEIAAALLNGHSQRERIQRHIRRQAVLYRVKQEDMGQFMERYLDDALGRREGGYP